MSLIWHGSCLYKTEMKKKILYKEVHPRSLVKTTLVLVGVTCHSRAMGNFYLSFNEG